MFTRFTGCVQKSQYMEMSGWHALATLMCGLGCRIFLIVSDGSWTALGTVL